MARGHWEKFARGAAAIAFAASCHCSLLFDLGGLDDGLPDGGPFDSAAPPVDGAPARPDAPSDSDAAKPPTDAALDRPGDSADGARADAPASDVTVNPIDAAPDASEGGAACTTSFSRGSADLLFSFNTTDVAGWASSTGSGGPTATLGWTGTDGATCPGALTMNVTFRADDGSGANMEFTYGRSVSWAATKLHVWVKIVISEDGGPSDYLGLGNLSLFVFSNTWANFTSVTESVNPTFSDGGWHEVVLDLFAADSGEPGRIGPDVLVSSVQRLGITITSPTASPPGGPPVAPATEVLLDDVWLE